MVRFCNDRRGNGKYIRIFDIPLKCLWTTKPNITPKDITYSVNSGVSTDSKQPILHFLCNTWMELFRQQHYNVNRESLKFEWYISMCVISKLQDQCCRCLHKKIWYSSGLSSHVSTNWSMHLCIAHTPAQLNTNLEYESWNCEMTFTVVQEGMLKTGNNF